MVCVPARPLPAGAGAHSHHVNSLNIQMVVLGTIVDHSGFTACSRDARGAGRSGWQVAQGWPTVAAGSLLASPGSGQPRGHLDWLSPGIRSHDHIRSSWRGAAGVGFMLFPLFTTMLRAAACVCRRTCEESTPPAHACACRDSAHLLRVYSRPPRRLVGAVSEWGRRLAERCE